MVSKEDVKEDGKEDGGKTIIHPKRGGGNNVPKKTGGRKKRVQKLNRKVGNKKKDGKSKCLLMFLLL